MTKEKFVLVGVFLAASAILAFPEDRPTPTELFRTTHEKVTYRADPPKLNIIQPPNFTVEYRLGDCEDIALLYLEALHYYYSYEGYLVVLKDRVTEAQHMVVFEPGCKRFQDPTNLWQKTVEEVLLDWEVVAIYTYREYLSMAYSFQNLQLLSTYHDYLTGGRE